MAPLLEKLKSLYNQELEDLCVRLLYFFNTIDTYFLVAGLSSFIIVCFGSHNALALALGLALGIATSKIADFHPFFAVPAALLMLAAQYLFGLSAMTSSLLLFANCAIFFMIQFGFMGIPDSIVARDPKVAFFKIFNSLFTVAPTTVSFSMSLIFSMHLSFWLYAATECRSYGKWALFTLFAATLLSIAGAVRYMLPKNRPCKVHMPEPPEEPPFERLLILNIDGTRMDVFKSLELPTAERLKQEGACHEKGLETVYRALTNPAFASIFTGAPPAVHGVRDNNFGQRILTEGLPDKVPAIAYGSMHVKHFCKPSWETKIVSLPETSAYGCDERMVSWLLHDIETRPELRLFVADFSEADFLAHAYGSKSRQYKEALGRIDSRIGEILDWLQSSGFAKGTGVIVCSDHGIAAIDHSYLLADSERWVPFMLWGEGVRKGFKLDAPGKIMDICCTAAWALGIPYPCDAKGQVFIEAFEEAGQ